MARKWSMGRVQERLKSRKQQQTKSARGQEFLNPLKYPSIATPAYLKRYITELRRRMAELPVLRTGPILMHLREVEKMQRESKNYKKRTR
ncbi:MAG: hypothetical protein PHD95_05980 [Candidatus ainarchaeum sp.]|nr:hypothetical protein [Candidatus ainarchaeum sp.]